VLFSSNLTALFYLGYSRVSGSFFSYHIDSNLTDFCSNGGPSLFRIYQDGGEFKDYVIRYDDLQVEIHDGDAEFLESTDGTEFYLDNSRKVLGQEARYDREDSEDK